MTANEWRLWFIRERLKLHDLLVKCLENSVDAKQVASVFVEHDMYTTVLAQHATKRVVRAGLVDVLAVRCRLTA